MENTHHCFSQFVPVIPCSRGLSKHRGIFCEECCIPAHMRGWGYPWEEACGTKCQSWVVTRNLVGRYEPDGCIIYVFQRTLMSILHPSLRKITSLDAKIA